jgi:excisionase family DNA binding protein
METSDNHLTARLLTIGQLAHLLQVPVGTLYQWRHRHYGPAGRRVGRHVRYRPEDVEAWLDSLDDEAA